MLRLPVVVGALLGCTNGMHDPSTIEQQNGACFELEGRTFTSVNELECGLTPDGVSRCHWIVSFATRDTATSDVSWSYSDIHETGRAECRGQAVVATTGGRTVHGTYDPDSGTLIWAGEHYVTAP
jgi:hypothetical protein